MVGRETRTNKECTSEITIKSNRYNDSRNEQIIKLYSSQMYRAHGFKPYYTKSRDMQICGIDVCLLDSSNKMYYSDEKAAMSRMDGTLKTFAFEMFTKNNPNGIGWFLNKNSKNTHYSIIYIKSNENNINQIEKIEILFVNKEYIRNKIKKYLINVVDLENIRDIVKYGNKFNGKRYIHIRDGVRIVYSENIFPEQPINIVVPKNIIQECSEFVMYAKFRNTQLEDGTYNHEIYYYDESLSIRGTWFNE